MLSSLPAVALALAPTVAGEPGGAELRWSAPDGCPDAGAIRRGAAALLGRPIDPDIAGERVLVAGSVVREPAGFRLDLELRKGAAIDRRTLRDPRCEVLADSAALIVAAAIDPDLGPPPALPPDPASSPAAPPEAPPAPAPDPAPTASPVPADSALDDPLAAPVPVPEDTPKPPAPARLRGAVRLSGAFDQGSLPGPTGGPALAFALLGGRWRVELGALWLAAQVARPDPERDLGARLSLGAASLRGCGVAPLAPRVELAGCGGLEAGALVGRAVGDEVGRRGSGVAPWLAARVGSMVAWTPRPRLALVLELGAAVPLIRAPFTLQGFGTLFPGNPAALRAGLGVEVRFP